MKINHPDLWRDLIPVKTQESHKYKHGHVLIYGSSTLTGATRLAASACARMGAGLVSVLADPDVADIYKIALPPHILVHDDPDWFDKRVTAKLYGPGGLNAVVDFKSNLPVVLDADALLNLPKLLAPNFILTPHEGEFERAFPNIKGSRIEKSIQVAESLNAHVILKGPQTIIAAPNGSFVLNDHASPWLATAGTGDVLAGMVAGLVGQNMPVFEACCAGVWIHGDCAIRFGAGLVASDLVEGIPTVLKSLL